MFALLFLECYLYLVLCKSIVKDNEQKEDLIGFINNGTTLNVSASSNPNITNSLSMEDSSDEFDEIDIDLEHFKELLHNRLKQMKKNHDRGIHSKTYQTSEKKVSDNSSQLKDTFNASYSNIDMETTEDYRKQINKTQDFNRKENLKDKTLNSSYPQNWDHLINKNDYEIENRIQNLLKDIDGDDYHYNYDSDDIFNNSTFNKTLKDPQNEVNNEIKRNKMDIIKIEKQTYGNEDISLNVSKQIAVNNEINTNLNEEYKNMHTEINDTKKSVATESKYIELEKICTDNDCELQIKNGVDNENETNIIKKEDSNNTIKGFDYRQQKMDKVYSPKNYINGTNKMGSYNNISHNNVSEYVIEKENNENGMEEIKSPKYITAIENKTKSDNYNAELSKQLLIDNIPLIKLQTIRQLYPGYSLTSTDTLNPGLPTQPIANSEITSSRLNDIKPLNRRYEMNELQTSQITTPNVYHTNMAELYALTSDIEYKPPTESEPNKNLELKTGSKSVTGYALNMKSTQEQKSLLKIKPTQDPESRQTTKSLPESKTTTEFKTNKSLTKQNQKSIVEADSKPSKYSNLKANTTPEPNTIPEPKSTKSILTLKPDHTIVPITMPNQTSKPKSLSETKQTGLELSQTTKSLFKSTITPVLKQIEQFSRQKMKFIPATESTPFKYSATEAKITPASKFETESKSIKEKSIPETGKAQKTETISNQIKTYKLKSLPETNQTGVLESRQTTKSFTEQMTTPVLKQIEPLSRQKVKSISEAESIPSKYPPTEAKSTPEPTFKSEPESTIEKSIPDPEKAPEEETISNKMQTPKLKSLPETKQTPELESRQTTKLLFQPTTSPLSKLIEPLSRQKVKSIQESESIPSKYSATDTKATAEPNSTEILTPETENAPEPKSISNQIQTPKPKSLPKIKQTPELESIQTTKSLSEPTSSPVLKQTEPLSKQMVKSIPEAETSSKYSKTELKTSEPQFIPEPKSKNEKLTPEIETASEPESSPKEMQTAKLDLQVTPGSEITALTESTTQWVTFESELTVKPESKMHQPSSLKSESITKQTAESQSSQSKNYKLTLHSKEESLEINQMSNIMSTNLPITKESEFLMSEKTKTNLASESKLKPETKKLSHYIEDKQVMNNNTRVKPSQDLDLETSIKYSGRNKYQSIEDNHKLNNEYRNNIGNFNFAYNHHNVNNNHTESNENMSHKNKWINETSEISKMNKNDGKTYDLIRKQNSKYITKNSGSTEPIMKEIEDQPDNIKQENGNVSEIYYPPLILNDTNKLTSKAETATIEANNLESIDVADDGKKMNHYGISQRTPQVRINSTYKQSNILNSYGVDPNYDFEDNLEDKSDITSNSPMDLQLKLLYYDDSRNPIEFQKKLLHYDDSNYISKNSNIEGPGSSELNKNLKSQYGSSTSNENINKINLENMNLEAIVSTSMSSKEFESLESPRSLVSVSTENKKNNEQKNSDESNNNHESKLDDNSNHHLNVQIMTIASHFGQNSNPYSIASLQGKFPSQNYSQPIPIELDDVQDYSTNGALLRRK